MRRLVVAPGEGPRQVAGARVVRVRGFRFPLYPELTLAPLAPALRHRLEQFQPDIVHLAGPAVLGFAGLRVAKRLKLPVAAHFQTDLARYAAYFGFPALSPLMWRFLVALHNQCDLNYAPAPSVGRELTQRGMRNVRVSGRGVDTELFRPNRRNGHAVDLLYVGRVSSEKNIEWLADVAQAFPDRTLQVVGDGPARAALEQRLRSPNVSFSGYLFGEPLAEAFASASLFLFPSETETFGQVVQEAMASGLPVVGMRAGGVADLVQPGQTGLLCPPGDRAAFVRAAGQLLEHDELRRTMSANARAFAEAQSWQRVFDQLLEDYEVLRNRRQPC